MDNAHLLQEVKDEAKRKEATHRGEEAVPRARLHQSKGRRLRPKGAGGVATRDRPERMARQQQ